jgi:hypothetical protein
MLPPAELGVPGGVAGDGNGARWRFLAVKLAGITGIVVMGRMRPGAPLPVLGYFLSTLCSTIICMSLALRLRLFRAPTHASYNKLRANALSLRHTTARVPIVGEVKLD